MKMSITAMLVLILAAGASGGEPVDALDAKTLAKINQAALVFTAKVSRSVLVDDDWGGAHHELDFADVTMLRGVLPAKQGFAIRVDDPAKAPHYPKDAQWLVATGAFPGATHDIDVIRPLSDRSLALAREAVALPLGWTLDAGRPISPWASLGAKAWPKGMAAGEVPVCSKTSRPALLAGKSVDLVITQINPPGAHPFRNPYGDGRFKVEVVNQGAQPATVPALLSDGKKILWDDSLVILDVATVTNFGAACVLAGAGKAGQAKEIRPVVLQPNESVATTIDVLSARGVYFSPNVSVRYYYRFCLGELSTVSYFYYHIEHHGRLRKASLP
jgi:hypothetical protein